MGPLSKMTKSWTAVVPAVAQIADATAIHFENFSGGIFEMLAASANVTVTFYVSHDKGTTYSLFEESKTVTASTLKSYAFPTGLFGAERVKMVVNGTATTCQVTLKS